MIQNFKTKVYNTKNDYRFKNNWSYFTRDKIIMFIYHYKFALGKKTDLITSGKQNGYVFRYLNTRDRAKNLI